MNNNIKNTFRNGLLAVAGLAALYSCSDTWEEHYDSVAGMKYDGTTMQAIQEKSPNFAKVLVAAGYDRELNSDNVYTIWVPEVDAATADSYIQQIKDGDKDRVVKKFIKSHVARYNVSVDNEAKDLILMNEKRIKLGDATAPTFGDANIKTANISCSNGVLHLIDKVNPYSNNVYEMIEDLQRHSELTNTMYKFLESRDSFILDEERSVYRGVNENGERVYVDSVVERWNRALSRVDALVYEEDSSYTAIVPTPEAYQKRYDIAASLLNFNPEVDKAKPGTADSLRNEYANMFAMRNLYFNDNYNKHPQDSLMSTLYSPYDWEEDVFYRPFDGDGILAEGKYTNKYECSNGTVYEVDEYPLDVTEQFFTRIKLSPLTDSYVDRSENESGKAQPYATSAAAQSFMSTRLSYYPHVYTPVFDEEGDPTGELEIVEPVLTSDYLTYVTCLPSSSSASPKYSFQIPNTLSGTYEIQLVTVPYWIAQEQVYNNAAYRFYAYIWEKQDGTESGSAEAGEYPTSGGVRLTAADEKYAQGNYIVTSNLNPDSTVVYTDTISLGEYTFKNSYYSQHEEGVLLQIAPQVTSAQMRNGLFTKNMNIAAIILKPKFDEVNGEAVESKRR